MNRSRFFRFTLAIGLAVTLLIGALGVWPVQSAVPHLGYGFNVADVGAGSTVLQQMGFNWIKIFDVANPQQLVLLRVDVTASTTPSALHDDIAAKLGSGSTINAWEIGNEPNIDASYGWAAPPDALAYKDKLCAAYTQIKAAAPNAIVVSAGLAPTGRITGNYNGHPGNNGQAQDDRQFLDELLKNGGGACLDAVGYHPYGYLADYDVAPDVVNPGVDPQTDPRACPNGFCFRGAEKIYQIMQDRGLGGKKVWATEFGWLTAPSNPDCLNDPSWVGRQWQIVSEEKQAQNLVGAYQYAEANWPWMGAMFVFNLGFDQIGSLGACDQMRSYDVQGKPAQAALQAMAKNPASIEGKLKTDVTQVSLMIGVGEQPITLPTSIGLSNWGWNPTAYTATVSTNANVIPTLLNPTGWLSATAQQPLNLTLTSTARAAGIYTGLLTVNWSAIGVNNPAARKVNIELRVVEQIHRTYLPAILR